MYCFSFSIFRSVCSYCHKWVYKSTYKKAHKGTCARLQKKVISVAILQYRRCNITIWKKNGETIASGKRQKLVFVEEINQRNDKKCPFHRRNGLKSTYLSMVCRLSNSCEEWFSWVECTALNWIFHRLDIFFSSPWNFFFALLKKLFHYSDKFFSSLRKSLQKVCWRILIDIHFCHCQPIYKLLSPKDIRNWPVIFATSSSEIDFTLFWFTFASVLRPHGRDNDYGEG